MERGLIYLSHIPKGFFENEIRRFFKQFGHVTNVRVLRSHNSGKSKGAAFVEFYDPDVAKIAAETMDNYLMFKRRLEAKYIEPEARHRDLFKTIISEAKFPKKLRQKATVTQKNQKLTPEKHQKKVTKKVKALQKAGMLDFCQVQGVDVNKIIAKPVEQATLEPQEETETFSDDSIVVSEAVLHPKKEIKVKSVKTKTIMKAKDKKAKKESNSAITKVAARTLGGKAGKKLTLDPDLVTQVNFSKKKGKGRSGKKGKQ